MKEKILTISCIICGMLIAIFIGHYFGMQELNSSVEDVNDNGKVFYKNGYRFKKAELPSGYFKNTEELQCFNPFYVIGDDKIREWIYLPRNDRAYKIADAYASKSYTMKYDLALLFIIQNLPTDEKIEKLKSLDMDEYTRLTNLIDTGKQYKIAKDYCIVFNTETVYIGNNQFKVDGENVYKVQCTPYAVSLKTQPYMFAFKENDKNGVYYNYYDFKNLWKQFEKLGPDGVTAQINEERGKFINYLYTNCSRSLGL